MFLYPRFSSCCYTRDSLLFFSFLFFGFLSPFFPSLSLCLWLLVCCVVLFPLSLAWGPNSAHGPKRLRGKRRQARNLSHMDMGLGPALPGVKLAGRVSARELRCGCSGGVGLAVAGGDRTWGVRAVKWDGQCALGCRLQGRRQLFEIYRVLALFVVLVSFLVRRRSRVAILPPREKEAPPSSTA